MNCPHCHRAAEFKVLESRRVDNAVWRLRTCRNCFKPFVSKEVTDPAFRMPYSSIMQKRKADNPAPPPPVPQHAPRGDGKHLQNIWK